MFLGEQYLTSIFVLVLDKPHDVPISTKSKTSISQDECARAEIGIKIPFQFYLADMAPNQTWGFGCGRTRTLPSGWPRLRR